MTRAIKATLFLIVVQGTRIILLEKFHKVAQYDVHSYEIIQSNDRRRTFPRYVRLAQSFTLLVHPFGTPIDVLQFKQRDFQLNVKVTEASLSRSIAKRAKRFASELPYLRAVDISIVRRV